MSNGLYRIKEKTMMQTEVCPHCRRVIPAQIVSCPNCNKQIRKKRRSKEEKVRTAVTIALLPFALWSCGTLFKWTNGYIQDSNRAATLEEERRTESAQKTKELLTKSEFLEAAKELFKDVHF
jgi:hypothetical protein